MRKILGKFYRVRYDGEGVYEALRKKVGWNWKNVKQDPDINWLPTPDCEYKDSYRSFFTTLGYNTFKAKTMKVISKYLDPSKIEVKEYEDLEGNLVYQDQYQVVVNNKQYFNESGANGNNIIFSENDIYLNWEKWITGESHVIIVDGLSGSGKSTLAKKISHQSDAIYVEIDVIAFKIVGQKAIERDYCNWAFIRDRDPLLYRYMKTHNISPDFLSHLEADPVTFQHPPEQEEYKQQEIDKYIEWLCFEQKQKVVIEGGHVGITLSKYPEKYKNVPIIFKGTSLFKSILRRFIRSSKKGEIYASLSLIFKIKAQYIDKMLPEVNSARKAMLTNREDDILYVDEGFTPIEAKKDKSSIHKKDKIDLRKIPTNIKDFKEFLQRIKTPEMVMLWFLKNKIKWTPHDGSNDHPFQWPDYLIKQKMGNCFDQSVFMHYFCKAKKLEHKMYLVSWLADNGSGTGHAVPLYKKNGYVYVFTYLRPGVGYIAGPFRSFDEAKSVLDKFFLMYINRSLKSPTTPYSSFLSDDDINNFDKYYNDRNITQTDYIIEGLGKNMRSSHMFKLKAKGFTFPNPILPVYDIITFLYRSIALIYSHLVVDANTEIIDEEGDIMDNEDYIEESNDYSKYTRSYKSFDEFCKYIRTPEEVMNWYKINQIKWNAPDKNYHYYKKPVNWPDDLIKLKEGNCFDHSLFMYYFCKKHHIDNYIVRFVRYRLSRTTNEWWFMHHFVTILKLNAGWVAFDYDSLPDYKHGFDERNMLKSSLIGPFKTPEDAVKFFTSFYDNIDAEFNKRHEIDWYDRERIGVKVFFLNSKVLSIIDKLYGDRSFTQEELYNLVKNEMGDTKYEGQYHECDSLFADLGNKAIVYLNKIRKFREEAEFMGGEDYIEEAKLSADERRCYGLPKKKKYPMPDEAHVRAAIRFFNHCDPEDEEELAHNINKYIRKYNMKNVNVGENNRFKKYYKPVVDSKPVKEDYIKLPFLSDHGDGTAAISTRVINELTNVRKSSTEELLEIANFIDILVDSSKRTLKIMESGGGCIVGMDINNVTVQNYSPGMFIIQYNTEDEKKAYAISNDIKTKYIYREKDHNLVRENYEWLNNKAPKIYKVDISCMDKWKDLLLKVLHNKQITSIYEELTGKRMLNENQFNLDDRFKEVLI